MTDDALVTQILDSPRGQGVLAWGQALDLPPRPRRRPLPLLTRDRLATYVQLRLAGVPYAAARQQAQIRAPVAKLADRVLLSR